MTPDELPEEALSEKFLAATGPGGQNVNKVATACQLRCDVYKLGLSPDAYARLKIIAGSKLTTGGELVITARRYRTQEGNRADARERLAEMITAAHIVQARRRPTKPSPRRPAGATASARPAAASASQASGFFTAITTA